MMRKKQRKKLAYVGRRRGARGKRGASGQERRAPVASADGAPQALGDAAAAATRADARVRLPWEKHPLWLDPSAPLPTSMYKTIPLHVDGQGIAPATERHPLPGAAASVAATSVAPGPCVHSSPENPIENLDRVVHDFVGSLDQGTFGSGDGTLSAQAERFRQLLESPPSMKGLVLGPPVILGASPAIGLESTLGLLGSLRKTGVLRVQAGGVSSMVSIVKGDVVHGMSHPRPEPELLANILLARGTLDAPRLSQFFETYGSSVSSIAEALNQQALVNTDQLREALEYQLQLLFDRLLATRESVWCFHEGEATLAYINMRINVISVLLESARKSDELGS